MHHGATAADSTGCVTITLDTTGRVDEIRLSARWRDKLGSEQVAGALTEAWIVAISQRPRRRITGRDDRQSRLSVEESRRLLLESAEQMQRERLAREREYDGCDIRRHVTVSLTLDEVLTRLELSDEWLRSASTERLAETVLEAFSDAYGAVDAAKSDASVLSREVTLDG